VSITDDPQVERVLKAVEATSGDRGRAVAWLQEPLATFNGKTGGELIAGGRAGAVLRYLASITSGFASRYRCHVLVGSA
jgi:Protein of unknown function (DUF2384)